MSKKIKNVLIIIIVVILAELIFVNLPIFFQNINNKYEYLDVDLQNIEENDKNVISELGIWIASNGGSLTIRREGGVSVTNIRLRMRSYGVLLQSGEIYLNNQYSRDFQFYTFDLSSKKVKERNLRLNANEAVEHIEIKFDANAAVSLLEKIEINPKLNYFISIKRIIAFCLLFLFIYIIITLKLKSYLAPVIGGFILSITTVAGKYVEYNISFYILDRDNVCDIIIIGTLISAGIIAVLELWPRLIKERLFKRQLKKERWISPKMDFMKRMLHSKLFLWGFIFVSWIPAFLAAWPGIMAYDTGMQLLQGVVLNVNDNHHPILHTMILTTFYKVSNNLFGNYEIGIMLYTLVQMLILSYAFAAFIRLLAKFCCPDWVYLITLLGFAFLPHNQIYAVNVTKDIFFTTFFLMFIIYLAEMIFFTDDFFNKKLNIIKFIGISFLMNSFRNNGIYIFIVSAVFIVKALKRKRFVALLSVSLVLVMWVVYTGPIFSVMDVQQAKTREALSVPMQALARTAIFRGRRLTSDEMEFIESYIPDYKKYNAYISDPIKTTFNEELINQSLIPFLREYIRIFFKHPQIYFDAFLVNTSGFWYLGYEHIYNVTKSPAQYIEYDSGDFSEMDSRLPDFTRRSKMPWLDELYRKYCRDVSFEKIPGARLFLSPSSCLVWLVLGIIVVIRKKEYRFMYVVVPLLTLFGILMFAPVALMRYSFPLMCVLPIFFIPLFGRLSKNMDVCQID